MKKDIIDTGSDVYRNAAIVQSRVATTEREGYNDFYIAPAVETTRVISDAPLVRGGTVPRITPTTTVTPTKPPVLVPPTKPPVVVIPVVNEPVKYLPPETTETINSGSSTTNENVSPVFADPNTVDIPDAEVVTEENISVPIPIGGGGGGGGGGSTEQLVTADGGFVQKASGITITGWVYPYPFLAMVVAGGVIGFFVAKKYKQQTAPMLALIAAGMMATSAIGMKTFPPVRSATV